MKYEPSPELKALMLEVGAVAAEERSEWIASLPAEDRVMVRLFMEKVEAEIEAKLLHGMLYGVPASGPPESCPYCAPDEKCALCAEKMP